MRKSFVIKVVLAFTLSSVCCGDTAFAQENKLSGHAALVAAPYCGEVSDALDRFFDPVRRLCVKLNRLNSTVPLSSPCPPGSGRRDDDFVCRGEIVQAFEVKCRHSWNVLPTKPFYANQDYQCVQILTYIPRGKRCPVGFQLKKLIDRYGHHAGLRPTICVATTTRPAEIIQLDESFVTTNCKVVPDVPLPMSSLYFDETSSAWEPFALNVDDSVNPTQIHGPGRLPKGGKFSPKTKQPYCLAVATDKVVKCPPEGRLVQDVSSGVWNCETETHVQPEYDTVGCKANYYWSTEYDACISVNAYTPAKSCPLGYDKQPYRHSGVARRSFRAPRYYGDEEEPYRCVADNTLPDNPFCPPGYWIEMYKGDLIPKCIQEIVYDPVYSCESVLESQMIHDPSTNDKVPRCEIQWDESLWVAGTAPMSRRQRMDSQHNLRKPAMTPYDIIRGKDDINMLHEGSVQATSSEFAWEAAVKAALHLLRPGEEGNETQADRSEP